MLMQPTLSIQVARVLVLDLDVDLDETTVSDIEPMLRREGFGVLRPVGVAGDVADLARELLPDLILLRCGRQLSRVVGYVQSVRAQALPVPIVIFSTERDDSLEREALAAGADACLDDSGGSRILAARLRAILRRTQPAEFPARPSELPDR